MARGKKQLPVPKRYIYFLYFLTKSEKMLTVIGNPAIMYCIYLYINLEWRCLIWMILIKKYLKICSKMPA